MATFFERVDGPASETGFKFVLVTDQETANHRQLSVGANFLYGYRKSTDGPGDGAFDKCVQLARKEHRPFVWIWGKDNCEECSKIVETFSGYYRTIGGGISNKKWVTGYFRGNDSGLGPPACLSARTFFESDPDMKASGGMPGDCHVVGFYAPSLDGSVIAHSFQVQTNLSQTEIYNTFFEKLTKWTNEFNAHEKNLPPSQNQDQDETCDYLVVNTDYYGVPSYKNVTGVDILRGWETTYQTDGRKQVSKEEPKYGIQYDSGLKVGSLNLDVATKVIDSALSNKVPLVVDFTGNSQMRYRTLTQTCDLPAFFLKLPLATSYSLNSGNQKEENRKFCETISSMFIEKFQYDPFRKTTIGGTEYLGRKCGAACFYDGKVVQDTEIDDGRKIESAGFMSNVVHNLLDTCAPKYVRKIQFEQSERMTFKPTKYGMYANKVLSKIDMSSKLDEVYTSKYHIAPDCNTSSDFRYGTWYGSGKGGLGADKFGECHADELFKFCEDNNIPLIVYQTDVTGGCGICNSVHQSFVNQPCWRNWLVKSPYMFFVDISWKENTPPANSISQHGITMYDSTDMCLYWKKKDGSKVIQRIYITSTLNNRVNKDNTDDAFPFIYDQMHKAVDYLCRDYERDQRFENGYCKPYLSSYDPDDPEPTPPPEPSEDDSQETLNKTWKHVFETPGNKKITINNKLKTIVQVIKDKTKIVDITLGDGISAIEDDCFRGFSSLSSVNGGKNCQHIGNQAFENCSSLVNCDMVNGNTTITYIGSSAFRNTGLNKVALDLYGETYAGGIEENAFSDCKSLTGVTMLRSSMIPQKGFENCQNLKEIVLPNSTSFVYDGCFKNCKNIEKFTFPPKIWGIGANMFEGCTNLKEVVIQDTQESPSIMRTLGANAFSGCTKLTSLTLPRSIKEIQQIDPAFLSGSSINTLFLRGIDDKTVGDSQQTTTKIPVDGYGYITSRTDMIEAYNDANKRGIPIVVVTQYDPFPKRHPGCGYCERLSNILESQEWKDFMKRYRNICYFFFAAYNGEQNLWYDVTYGQKSVRKVFPNWFYGYYTFNPTTKMAVSVSNNLYAKLALYWKKPGQSYQAYNIKLEGGNQYYKDGKTIKASRVQYIESIIKDQPELINYGERKELTFLTKFGSPLNKITVATSSNTFYTISADHESQQFSPPEPDDETEDGFLPGVWYGNAIKLKEYADANHVPCFVEFSDAGCTPCKEFRSTIYNTPDFQKWVKNSGYYYCRIETQTHSMFNQFGTNPYFVYHTWAKETSMIIPIFIYYWNKEDGTTVWNISSYHDTKMTAKQLQNSISSNFQ